GWTVTDGCLTRCQQASYAILGGHRAKRLRNEWEKDGNVVDVSMRERQVYERLHRQTVEMFCSCGRRWIEFMI
ncbi:hypothetical protein BaRGS_00028841, partial [Batillaria attramentaria]